ncbi:hypothetical protein [Tabrizicola thermarum]|uniref:hypothetical protein n=1 Tax=Tabrizicola thermarum TaxID=2670345 RepID=UPI000FFCBEE2|nr:hypothetical protein [Tabrizicola thermarum]
MAGFFTLKSDAIADQEATGEAIIRVSKSAFRDTPNSEWKKFNDDTRKWLFDNGYRYEGPGAGPNGEIPDSIEIVPVYDTPNRMHVRVPWAGDLKTFKVKDEATYGNTDKVRSRVVLARYFMRKCR